MSAKVEFTPVWAHKPGTIRQLLASSYEGLIAAGRLSQIFPSGKWPAFDAEVFENPDTLGRCAFITCVDSQPVGFTSWDPRCGPAHGVIGHNCVVPEHRGKGYGKQQIQEVLRRFREAGFRKAIVITGDEPFFLPAQRMYRSCGFVEVARMFCRPDLTYGTIKYELDLTIPADEVIRPRQVDSVVPLFS
jgi:GNAT superfamily N-acetyltransferase